jgi:hypothetical protein
VFSLSSLSVVSAEAARPWLRTDAGAGSADHAFAIEVASCHPITRPEP